MTDPLKTSEAGPSHPLGAVADADLAREIETAKSLVTAIVKARKNMRLYLPNNPIYQQTIAALSKAFENAFESQEAVTIDIQRTQILCGGKPIYQSAEVEDNLAALFYKDGIRNLTFLRGITDAETAEFLEIIQLGGRAAELDDDVVTLMWEKDLEHVRYIVVEEGDESDPGLLPRGARPGAAYGNLTEAHRDAVAAPAGPRAGAEEIRSLAATPGFEDLSSFPKELMSPLPLDEDDIRRLKIQIQDKRNALLLHRTVDICVEILFQDAGANPAGFEESVRTLERLGKLALMRGEYRLVADLLGQFRQMLGDKEKFDEKERNLLRQTRSALGNEARLAEVGQSLEQGIPYSPEALEAYLVSLDETAILPLCDLLGLKEMKNRRVIVNALTVLGKKHMEALVRGLSDSRWYIVRNIIYILGRLDDARAAGVLKRFASNPEARVRMEAVRSLGLLGAPAAEGLGLYLDDADSQVRLAAIRYLGATRAPEAVRRITERIRGKGFKDLPNEATRAHLEAYAEAAGPDALPLLEELATRGGWFDRGRIEEIQTAATAALGLVITPKSREILGRLAESKSPSVRSAAREALEKRAE
ncbi:MAG: HEAT repeat domain-containing protein [Nitrospirae bacterium]|nr:HEAT repeat domain-containing protein [Nitrospirota bacterium]